MYIEAPPMVVAAPAPPMVVAAPAPLLPPNTAPTVPVGGPFAVFINLVVPAAPGMFPLLSKTFFLL